MKEAESLALPLEDRGAGLPERPPCFPKSGRIFCECTNTMKSYECSGRRKFWLHALTIAHMPSDAVRREYMLGIGRPDRRDLGRAAQLLISEGA